MNNYIVFLRGINVSGQNIIKMKLLKEAFLKNNLSPIQTYIQSGNIFIPHYKDSSTALKHKIELILLKEFHIKTICIVKPVHELKSLIRNIPFPTDNTKQLYFTFTESTATQKNIQSLKTTTPQTDQFSVDKNCIYIRCINGFAKTKLTTNFFEKHLNLKATTRNWNTVHKMIAMANEN